MTESVCPECGTKRDDFTKVCPACGAPPGPRREGAVEGVRTTDLEPYITLRYIAKLFKVLAVLIVLMMVMEIVTGLLIDGRSAVMTLLGESTRLLVMAGLLWAGGDITLLLIDAGHDMRVVRILLGRINAEVHRTGSVTAPAEGDKAEPPRAATR
ncbi:MAG TPA: zinc ribbon domain-containing protein [Vicinamibacteria bacterium]